MNLASKAVLLLLLHSHNLRVEQLAKKSQMQLCSVPSVQTAILHAVFLESSTLNSRAAPSPGFLPGSNFLENAAARVKKICIIFAFLNWL